MTQLSSKLRSVDLGKGEKGIGFWCPGCREFHIICTMGNYAWQYDGNAEKPTISPSIKVEGVHHEEGSALYGKPKVCHTFIKAGRIEFLGDCTHELANQTVDLPDIPLDQPWYYRD